MKSRIFLNEVVANKDRKFGSQTQYYPARVVFENGDEIKTLFTRNQLDEAMKRASRNPEDFQESSFWDFLLG